MSNDRCSSLVAARKVPGDRQIHRLRGLENDAITLGELRGCQTAPEGIGDMRVRAGPVDQDLAIGKAFDISRQVRQEPFGIPVVISSCISRGAGMLAFGHARRMANDRDFGPSD